MKELFVNIITASVGVSLLSSAVVGERFRGNVKALSSLVIVASILSSVAFEFPKLEKSFQDISFDEGQMYSSVEEYAESIYSSLVEERIKESFNVERIEVHCDIYLDEYTATLESLAENAENLGACEDPGSGRQEYLESVVNQVFFGE